jgi:hypothetical protein
VRRVVALLRHNSATTKSLNTRTIISYHTARLQNSFFDLKNPKLFSNPDPVRELLIVGPRAVEWNLLRDTDGERFVGVYS